MTTVFQINEQVTARLTGVFKDELGVALGSASMEVLTATHYDKVSGAIINTMDHRDVLNANGGTLDGSGNFVFTLTPGDDIVVDQTRVGAELHVLLLEWQYAGGKKGKQEISLAVNNLTKVS